VSGCLAGIRVIDMTSVLMGPYATQLLGDMGADVIKVEPPAGDTTRSIGAARHRGMSSGFLNSNRNKRSVCLDLKHPDAHCAMRRLLADADVLVYNVRPQAMARLGLGYDDLRQDHPRLVHVGVFGYGQQGPYAAKAAYDDLIQAAIGLPSLMERAGANGPMYVPIAFVDRAVGLAAVNAVVGGLFHRERTGRGQAIEVPMFETMIPFVLGEHLGGETFRPAEGPIGYARLLARERVPFPTVDGHVGAVIYTDAHWSRFCAMVGDPDRPAADPRFRDLASRTRHVGELYAYAAEHFARRDTATWLRLLDEADIPAMRVHTVESLLDDPHLRATGCLRDAEHPTEGPIREIGPPGRWTDSPLSIRRPAPGLGQHTEEVLREAGLTERELAELLDAQAAFTPGRSGRDAR